MNSLALTVYGAPKTKGSMRHIGNGRMIEDHESSKPWREAVKWAALEAIAARRADDPFAILGGPVEVTAVFSFPKPKTAAKSGVTRPATRSSGDIDKLLRNIFDALVDAGAIADDSQIVRVTTDKAFAGEYPSGLSVPGAELLIRPLSTPGAES